MFLHPPFPQSDPRWVYDDPSGLPDVVSAGKGGAVKPLPRPRPVPAYPKAA